MNHLIEHTVTDILIFIVKDHVWIIGLQQQLFGNDLRVSIIGWKEDVSKDVIQVTTT